MEPWADCAPVVSPSPCVACVPDVAPDVARFQSLRNETFANRGIERRRSIPPIVRITLASGRNPRTAFANQEIRRAETSRVQRGSQPSA